MNKTMAIQFITRYQLFDWFEGTGSRSESDCRIANHTPGHSVSRTRSKKYLVPWSTNRSRTTEHWSEEEE